MCGSVHLQPALAADESSLDMRELVLDVPHGSAVLLRRKVRIRKKKKKKDKEKVFLLPLKRCQGRGPLLELN